MLLDRSIRIFFSLLFNCHLIQKRKPSWKYTNNRVCQKETKNLTIFSRQNTRGTHLTKLLIWFSTYVIKVESELSISKSRHIYGAISQILTLQNALCSCTYVLNYSVFHSFCFDEKKIFVNHPLALSLKPWQKDNNNEMINLGFIE